jgi:hypothetical protein
MSAVQILDTFDSISVPLRSGKSLTTKFDFGPLEIDAFLRMFQAKTQMTKARQLISAIEFAKTLFDGSDREFSEGVSRYYSSGPVSDLIDSASDQELLTLKGYSTWRSTDHYFIIVALTQGRKLKASQFLELIKPIPASYEPSNAEIENFRRDTSYGFGMNTEEVSRKIVKNYETFLANVLRAFRPEFIESQPTEEDRKKYESFEVENRTSLLVAKMSEEERLQNCREGYLSNPTLKGGTPHQP